MRNLTTLMNGTTKIDELAKKHIVLGGFLKRVVNTMFKFPKLSKNISGSFKI